MTPPFHPRLVIGLGNPGRTYATTYHNVGTAAVEYLLKESGISKKSPHHGASFDYWKLNTITIARTNTFMNDSGIAIREALKKFRVAPEELLVVHDESDLALGKTQCGFGRGAAGHRGVGSIIETIGTKNFWRFRIGIRTNKEKAEHFVLRKIRNEDAAPLYCAFEVLIRKVTVNE
jgi:peptidyl-tRNA hydrolase, PTH1 family